MASINPGTLIQEVVKIVADITIDKVELEGGVLVKVGEIGSIGGNPVFIYLSENPNAT